MKSLSVIGLCLCGFIVVSSATESEQVVLRAVLGRDATLPCGQGKVFLDGPDSYVLWMKDNKEFLYRYPNEDSIRSSIQTLEQVLGPQCDGNSCVDPTSLQLKRVSVQDGGVYRCRVHYQASPAVDFVIELRLVESPGTPKILNPDGFDLSGNVGQLSLGSNMTLICEVEDVENKPGTLLWWERNGAEMARAETVQDGVLRTTVRVQKATRNELDAHYVCLAQNADVTDPLTASVVVKMHLPPISVEIRLNNNLDFEAGQPRVVDCVVVGCVPPPTITWHLGDIMLRPSVHKELHDGNFTVSSLTLAPSLRDDKHELTCRAHNSHLPRDVFEDKVVLNVGFRPESVNNQEEVVGYMAGQTESVSCTVEAYPEPIQFSWTFADTKTLYTSVKKVPGYQHRYSSSLTWKPQDSDRGELLCRATNVLGEQKRACVYSIVVGGPPLAPDCELLNTDPKTIKISCKKCWNGGRPQTIHLELQQNGNTLQNVSDSYGHFALPHVQESNLTAVVYASNSRGRSEENLLFLKPRLNDTTVVPEKLPFKALLMEAVFGAVAAGTLLGLLYHSIRALRRKMDVTTTTTTDMEDEHTDHIIRSDGSFHRQPEFQVVLQEDRACPHVITRVPNCENHYSVTPSKAARLLGHTVISPPSGRVAFLDEAERTSYFV